LVMYVMKRNVITVPKVASNNAERSLTCWFGARRGLQICDSAVDRRREYLSVFSATLIDVPARHASH